MKLKHVAIFADNNGFSAALASATFDYLRKNMILPTLIQVGDVIWKDRHPVAKCVANPTQANMQAALPKNVTEVYVAGLPTSALKALLNVLPNQVEVVVMAAPRSADVARQQMRVLVEGIGYRHGGMITFPEVVEYSAPLRAIFSNISEAWKNQYALKWQAKAESVGAFIGIDHAARYMAYDPLQVFPQKGVVGHIAAYGDEFTNAQLALLHPKAAETIIHFQGDAPLMYRWQQNKEGAHNHLVSPSEPTSKAIHRVAAQTHVTAQKYMDIPF
jgi:hypothetical protein